MELSEERKRQIREEEEAKFRAEQAAEEQFREEVRKELAERQQAELEEQYRKQVQEELTGAASAPAKGTPPAAPRTGRQRRSAATVSPPAPAATATSKASKADDSRKPKPVGFVKTLVAVAVVLAGVSYAGMAFSRGFTLPFLAPRGEIVLRAGAAGEDWEEDSFGFSASDGKAPAPAARAKPTRVLPVASAVARVTSSSASTTPARAPVTPETRRVTTASAKRATLRGSGISIEVPEGWAVGSNDYEDMLEIGWRRTGIASGRDKAVAYLLLQKTDLRPRDSLEDFAEREMEAFESSLSPDQRVSYENEAAPSIQGLSALSIDVVMRGDWPYRMRLIFFVKGGKGYQITCYATGSTFADRAPAFSRMIKSIRL